MAKIVGRKREQEELKRLYKGNKPELVAVYGRRRVGKTFLIREFFKDKMCFYHTGISNIDGAGNSLKERQLSAFASTLQRYGAEIDSIPKDWFSAFRLLTDYLETKLKEGRQVVFIDEMPWMDTPRAGFMPAFENFWNGWASGQENLMLIVCGSATSWIQDNLINNHGGLYDRVTWEIPLAPFTLGECEEFFVNNNIRLTRYDIVQAYMAVGGVPFYLNYFVPGRSVAQNIDALFFGKKAKLKEEFHRLFTSLFINPTDYVRVVRLLGSRHIGFSRTEISEKLNIGSGRALTEILRILVANDLVDTYIPFGKSRRNVMYKLVDNFALFYLTFVDGNVPENNFWSNNQNLPKVSAWRGIAFEEVCFCHVPQIKRALGIAGVGSTESPFTIVGEGGRQGSQIDMVIDRADHIVNLCEIKFVTKDFAVDSAYDRLLRNRAATVEQHIKRVKSIHLTLITTFGLADGIYSSVFQNVITVEDLFS